MNPMTPKSDYISNQGDKPEVIETIGEGIFPTDFQVIVLLSNLIRETVSKDENDKKFVSFSDWLKGRYSSIDVVFYRETPLREKKLAWLITFKDAEELLLFNLVWSEISSRYVPV